MSMRSKTTLNNVVIISNPCCVLTSSSSSRRRRILYRRNPRFRLSHFLRFDSTIQLKNLTLNPALSLDKRRRFTSYACSAELPLLPFPIDQVLVPSESKPLHLYEARYLALLEESLFRKKRLFVHFVLDPIVINDTSAEVSFAARYGCLVLTEKIERLDVGALVTIRGIGRVKIVKFEQVKYELIADERARRETFRKRKAGFFKKVSELKTLCNIDACAIIYNKNGAQPDVWPSPLEARHLLQRFNDLSPIVKTSNMLDQEGFLRKNLLRLNKNLEREKKKNRRLEMEQLMTKCLVEENLHDVSNLADLKDLSRLLDEKIRSVSDKIETIKPFNSTLAVVGSKIEHGSERGKEQSL